MSSQKPFRNANKAHRAGLVQSRLLCKLAFGRYGEVDDEAGQIHPGGLDRVRGLSRMTNNPFHDWPSSRGPHGYRRRGIGEFELWKEKWEKEIMDELTRLEEIRQESLRIEDHAFRTDELYPFWNFVSTVIWSDVQSSGESTK